MALLRDAQIWKENYFLSVTGCCLEPPAIQFEESEQEWSSDTNCLLMLLRSLIMELWIDVNYVNLSISQRSENLTAICECATLVL